jgi:hypothetical protein
MVCRTKEPGVTIVLKKYRLPQIKVWSSAEQYQVILCTGMIKFKDVSFLLMYVTSRMKPLLILLQLGQLKGLKCALSQLTVYKIEHVRGAQIPSCRSSGQLKLCGGI